MSAGAKVPGTVAWRFRPHGQVAWSYHENEPQAVGIRVERDALISRAETVAWLRTEGAKAVCNMESGIGSAVDALADALERGEEGR